MYSLARAVLQGDSCQISSTTLDKINLKTIGHPFGFGGGLRLPTPLQMSAFGLLNVGLRPPGAPGPGPNVGLRPPGSQGRAPDTNWSSL